MCQKEKFENNLRNEDVGADLIRRSTLYNNARDHTNGLNAQKS